MNGRSDCRTIRVDVPEKFVQLCKEYYRIKPGRLAHALVYSFTAEPPTSLTLIEHPDPVDHDAETHVSALPPTPRRSR